MRTKYWALVAPLLATLSGNYSSLQAQESLAGLGAASSMGATLGAAASGGGVRARQSAQGMNMGAPGMPGAPDDGMMEDKGVNPQFPNGGVISTTTTQTTVTRITTPLAGRAGTGSAILGQLLAPRTAPRPIPERTRRSARGQSAYARRVARLSPTARKKLVLGKYRIPPRGYLASYLPQDRYKFAKAWRYVSTETDNFYYRPQDMARRRFNANRVIGFRTWQEAMLAGYRPDPVSKPEPGNQLAYLASLTRDEPLTQYVEYVYAGQVSAASVINTVNYVRRVKSVIDRNPRVRQYQRETVNSILIASLTGDTSIIPRQLGYVPPPMPVAGMGENLEFPTANVNNAPQGAGPLSNGGPPSGFRPPMAGGSGPFSAGGPPPGFVPPGGTTTGPPPGYRPPQAGRFVP